MSAVDNAAAKVTCLLSRLEMVSASYGASHTCMRLPLGWNMFAVFPIDVFGKASMESQILKKLTCCLREENL